MSQELEQPIYLDHAAATPLDPAVFEAMLPWLTQKFHNPSGLYAASRQASVALEDSRHQLAQILGAKKTEVIFTSGTTESVNLAILGVARSLKSRLSAKDRPCPINIVASSIEHESALASLNRLKLEGFGTRLVPVDRNGIIDLQLLAKTVDDQTALISVAYANSEIGTIQPIAKIGQLVAAVRVDRAQRGIDQPLYFHTDAAQAAGSLDLRVARLGVDLMSLGGSKIYGPKQVGCLYIRTGIQLQPLIFGGGQERQLRSGTENVAAVVGLSTALQLVQSNRQSENRRLIDLRDHCINQIKAVIPAVIINGDLTKRLPGNINLTIPGLDGETAVLYLDQAGIQISTGSACSAGSSDPSPVLLAIGRSRDQANSSLRLTLGHTTTKAQIDCVCKSLADIIKRLAELH